jgi:hypothetical protein
MRILFLFGVLLILGGIAAFGVAKSAIHEILGTLGIGFGLLICGLGVLASRLESNLEELQAVKRSLFKIAHPEVRWPPLSPNAIVHEERREGVLWRMRADGAWEFRKRGRWQSATRPTP